jgi:hypothetical protein
MASTIEYERWRNNKTGTPVAEKSKTQKSNALKNLAENNPEAEKSLMDIFNTFNID